jgi:galactokinase
MSNDPLIETFRERFSGVPTHIARAPGRVNLIGEHTDYNDGFVLPIAIDREIRFAVRPRDDRMVRLYSLDFNEAAEFSLDELVSNPKQPWSNYVRGMAQQLLKAGCELRGMDGVVAGDVPIGSGLSSSAAIEIAGGMAFLSISGESVDKATLALMGQAAENEFMGVRVGIMDQFISCLGSKGHALFLDCRSLDYDLVPIDDPDYLFVITNSKQGRELAGSAYNERRAQCEAAVAAIQRRRPEVKALRDATLADLDAAASELDEIILRCARYVIQENDRVLAAVAALREHRLEEFGQLMNASHDGLRDDYQVSSTALDTLVNASRDVEGCLGSRLTGAGFGGCTVSLVAKSKVEAFQKHVAAKYRQACGVEAEFYPVTASEGASATSV